MHVHCKRVKTHALQYNISRGRGRGATGHMLSTPAPASGITCMPFTRVTTRISAGSFPCPRATWSVGRCTRQKVEPRRRARVTTSNRGSRMSLLPRSATCGLRRRRELRPFEHQRWRSKEVELRIETYPASARGSKHICEQVIGARSKMGLCDPWWMPRRPIRWQQWQRRTTRSCRRG